MHWTPDEQDAYLAKYQEADYPACAAAALALCGVIGSYARMAQPSIASLARLRRLLLEAAWLLEMLGTENDAGERLGVDETTGALRTLTPAEQATDDAEAAEAEAQALFVQSLEADQDASQIGADLIHRVVDPRRRQN